MLPLLVSLLFALLAVVLGAVLAGVGGAALDLTSVAGAVCLVALALAVAVASLVFSH
jgi:hypothetical protein